MLQLLKQQVFEANKLLVKYNLVTLTWGNASGIDRAENIMVIKPSGVEYDTMKPEDMVLVNVDTGQVVEGSLKPSSDTATHLELYRRFEQIGGVVHTHSRWATIMAQAGLDVMALGTTHADYFYGAIPCTRDLSDDEIASDYEYNTGTLITETFMDIDPEAVPAVLVRGHGPFCWGRTPREAVEHALIIEEVSMMAYHNLLIDRGIRQISPTLLAKHYLRKHGAGAYYGQ
ncbi:MAG: L-ribulose-5-phosphate 4-epimerase [Oscillospiraceae bacterium]|nr:L-ribulose-5-phosphate 4-epimerase [Oscillospiraceae bacterium]